MKTSITITLVGLLAVSMGLVAMSAPGGKSGGKGGGKGGGSTPQVEKGDLYGDLYIVARNPNGDPRYFVWEWSSDSPLLVTETNAAGGFVQPVIDASLWEEQELLSLPDACFFPDTVDAELILVPLTVDGEVAEDYAAYTQEVELGRLNLARSPSSVLDAAYSEALTTINSALAVTTDACDRIRLLIGFDELDREIWKTIDSPRENLALYRELMLRGYCEGITLTPDLLGSLAFLSDSNVTEPLSSETLSQASALLAAAGDKGTEITVDEVIYLNNILEINDLMAQPPVYFDYMGYTYSRSRYAGRSEYLLVGPVELYLTNDLGTIYSGYYIDVVNILATVFPDEPTPSVEHGPSAQAFATSASDSLQVLTYIHDRSLPEIDIE